MNISDEAESILRTALQRAGLQVSDSQRKELLRALNEAYELGLGDGWSPPLQRAGQNPGT